MAIETVGVLIGIVSFVGGAGGAWGATRSRLHTVERKAEALTQNVRDHEDADVKQHTEIVQRLTRIETLIESIDKRV